jgi:hypothetical protein
MIRTGSGPFLPSLGIGVMLAGVLPFMALILALVAVVVLLALSLAVVVLLLAAPAALLLGAFGFLHLEEDDSGFVDAGD